MALTDKLKAIADAIRAKTGETNMLSLSEMPAEIEEIKAGADMDKLIEGSIVKVSSNVKRVSGHRFYGCGALTSIDLPQATEIGDHACYCCDKLTSINLPQLTVIGRGAFQHCGALTSIDLPQATEIGQEAFRYCEGLTSICLPRATKILSSAFDSCIGLTSIDLPQVTTFLNSVFWSCEKLVSVIMRSTELVSAYSTNSIFKNTPIASGTGYIYVPAALVDQYKVDENWSTYANQFRALEDYTVDGTTTGELDESKISTTEET